MDFLLYLVIVLLLTAAVVLVHAFGKLEYVANAKQLFKAWSVWLASIGSILTAWVASFPDAALNAWNVPPVEVKSLIPEHYLGILGAVMVALGVVSQLVRQKHLAGQNQTLED